MKKLHLLAFVCLIFGSISAYSEIRLVDNLNENGPGSLENEINTSNPGDTVIIDISGDLVLTNTMNITANNVVVIGPSPIYFSVKGNGFAGSLIDITGSNNLRFLDIGFIGAGAGYRAIRSSGNTGLVHFENCLFEDFQMTGGGGGAILYDGNASSPFSVLACSFINNSTDEDGGAVYVQQGVFRSANCTYFNNTATGATSTGGAVAFINNFDQSNFIHNTFKDNNSTNDGTCIAVLNTGGIIDLKGNAGAVNGSAAIIQFVDLGGSFLSHGGNVIAPNNGTFELMPWGFTTGDNSSTMTPFLHATIVVDGYGLKYFTIVDSNSAYCDIVPNVGIAVPGKDTRRAPRKLSANTPTGVDFNPVGDAGACEYTLLRVTNSGGDNNVPGRLPWAVLQNYNAENYIEFDLPLGFEINPLQPILETGFPTFIDGYSLTGTRIPGPEHNSTAGLQGGNIEVNVVNNLGHSFGIQLVGAPGSVLSGLRVTDFNEVGVVVSAANTTVQGCQIGIDQSQTSKPNFSSGIRVDNTSGVLIGGYLNANRNVVSGNGIGGGLDSVNIEIIGGGNFVQGNIIGLDTSGFSFITGAQVGAGGIRNSGGSNLIGGRGPLEGNTIGGNSTFGLLEYFSVSTKILQNRIGTDFKGNSSQSNSVGIRFDGATSCLVGGTHGHESRNIISANGMANILIIDGGDHFIEGNYIGLESSGTASLNISNFGILVDGPGVAGIYIGNGSDDGRNIISGNIEGISVKSSGGSVLIYNNFIGTDHTGNATVGNNVGVYLGINAASCNVGSAGGFGNLISDNSNIGVYIDSADAQVIQGNIIGLEFDGINAMANGVGIVVEGGTSNTIGGDSTAAQGNIVSGNSGNGILITDFAGSTDVFGNFIGLQTNGIAAQANGLNGIKIETVDNTTIGASGSYANIISGHAGVGDAGVFCEFSGNNTVFENNYIGTDHTGTLPLGNHTGVRITDDHDVLFGTGATGTENYVCASVGDGLHIISPNVVMNGFSVGIGRLGVDINMGNTLNGVLIEAPHVIVGLSSAPDNVIANNMQNGILLNGEIVDSVQVGYSNIGLKANGFAAGNGIHGIHILNGDYNEIGTFTNNIGANAGAGVHLTGSANENIIHKNNIGNTIGAAAPGTENDMGVQIFSGADNNIVGSTNSAFLNTIGGNNTYGVNISSDSNVVLGNFIGISPAAVAIPNSAGINLSGATGNVIGFGPAGVGAANVISGNTNQGVAVCCSSTGNSIAGNIIGLDPTGTSIFPNTSGVYITDSDFNMVGGDKTLNIGNVISGNTQYGVQIESADSNQVSGNIIGLNAANTNGLGNQIYGVVLAGSTSGNQIGGNRGVWDNHIAGNDSTGILITNAGDNLVGGNVIGAESSGSPLQKYGIVLRGGATNNNIIGEVPKSVLGNIIYKNNEAGILVENGANNNVISCNIIGLDSLNGIPSNAVQPVGVEISPTAGYSPVGLSSNGFENVISANDIGIVIDGNTGQDIVNNLIGTDTTGLFPRGNTSAGIQVSNGANSNHIGGANPFHANLISGNADGVRIEDPSTNGNVIINNIIGLNILQTDSIPNQIGVVIENGANGNNVGGGIAGESNIISGNHTGVTIDNAPANFVVGNKIGPINGNVFGVIVIGLPSSGTVIGGSLFTERNIISGNDSIGIGFSNTTGIDVFGNFIGIDEIGTSPLPNLIGVYANNSSGNQIGASAAGEGNVISSNSFAGIVIENGSDGNIFENNFVGTDSTGNSTPPGFGNEIGMFIIDSDGNQVGGDWVANEGNVFGGNDEGGIWISAGNGNTVEGNNIGLSKDNDTYLPNGNDGVRLDAGSTGNFIGTAGPGFENVITANTSSGIYLHSAVGNLIENNYIGNDDLGSGGSVSNGTNSQLYGISLDTASFGNDVFGKNVISGNSIAEVKISGPGTSDNTVSGNHIGVDFVGNTGISTASVGVYILGTATNNIIGGSNTADRNIFGGDIPEYIKIFGNGTDSNHVQGNYIGLGQDGLTTFANPGVGAVIDQGEYNIIGGGMPNEGNTIVGLNSYGIRILNAANNRVFGNDIGIKPNGSTGTIDSVGVRLENANSTYVGGILVGSDSANVITNCDGGVDVTDWFGIGSSYGCPIIGNSIYNNTHQGIDIHGDNLVLPNDTNNFNFDNNGLIDAPEIFDAWNCGGGGTTHIAFKYFSSNAIGTYRIDVYENTVPDANGYGEGEIFIGSFPFNPTNPYDTIDIDLGVVLPVGTIIAATMTGTALNTSEFSLNDTVTVAPTFNVASVVDESCFGANNGYVEITDALPLSTVSTTGGSPAIYGPDTLFLNSGTHIIEATYVNGCVLSQTVTLNPGPALPFTYTIIPDTCGLGVGSITIDTTSTNAGGGSNNYSYSFSNGAAYNNPIDTLNITMGTYNIGLVDNTLGCYSQIETFNVGEITDVADESFSFDDFCPGDTPFPYNIGDLGGVWSCPNGTINPTTGEITGAVTGTTYEVIYTVGICGENSTVFVTAADLDDSTFVYDDFCEGTIPAPTATTPGGTWSTASAGVTIDPNSGVLTGITGIHSVTYTTNGTCPTSHTLPVEIYAQPTAPEIMTLDSIYCPGDPFEIMQSSATGGSFAWYDSPDHSNVVSNTLSYQPTALITGDNYFYLTLTTPAGCESAHDSINYLLVDVSAMMADSDIVTCLSSTVQLGASGGVQYLWEMDTQIIGDVAVANPEAVINFETDFKVLIVDGYNCAVQDTLSVTLLPSDSCYVEVYNAFSPNGDQVNDIWIIDGIEGFPENNVYVYNRWGDIIIDFVNYDNSLVYWDGTNKSNKLLPAGTYFFVVEVGGTQNQAGWIQLVK